MTRRSAPSSVCDQAHQFEPLLPQKDLAEAAEACALVNEDLGWRAQLIDAGHERVKSFDPEKVAAKTKTVLGL